MLAVGRADNLSVVMPRPIPWNRSVSIARIENSHSLKNRRDPTRGVVTFLPGFFLSCPMTTLGSPDSISPAGNPNEVSGGSAGPLMTGNKLIGNVAQIIADDLRLRTDSQNIVADTLDQRCLPARRDGAKGIPGVTSDKAEL